MVKLYFRVVRNSLTRFYYDDCFSRASALAYSTLFALIPVTYMTLWGFGLLGEGQEGATKKFEAILFQILPPIQGEEFKQQIFDSLQSFASNVAQLKTISIIALLFSIYTLINTTESALNVVWRVNSSKSVFAKFADFSTVGLLGPILISFSFFLTSEITSNVPEGINHYITLLLPVAFTCLALTMLYYKLPSASVRLKHAAIGGFIAALLFEVSKSCFALFFEQASTYSKVYGVIASIPVFLIWLYVLWVVVLFGAELAYNCHNAKHLESLKKYKTEFGSLGAIIGLKLLVRIARAFENGDPIPDEGELASYTGAEPPVIRTVLDCLSAAKILTAPEQDTNYRSLRKSPELITINEVQKAFGGDNSSVFLDSWRSVDSSMDTGEVSLKSLIK